MTTNKSEEAAGVPVQGHHGAAEEIVVDALAGAGAGAALGAVAGPPGMAIGAVLGAVIGAAAGEALHLDHVEAEIKDEQLDRDIGVTEGNLGEASPDQPQGRGVFHAASTGVSTGGTVTPAEGPMQQLDED